MVGRNGRHLTKIMTTMKFKERTVARPSLLPSKQYVIHIGVYIYLVKHACVFPCFIYRHTTESHRRGPGSLAAPQPARLISGTCMTPRCVWRG